MEALRHAARTLRRSPGFTLIAALTLAVGIGANTAVFSVIDAVLLRPLPFPDADQLVDVRQTAERVDFGFSYPELLDYQRTGAFSEVAGYLHFPGDLTRTIKPERIMSLGTTGNYFQLLGAHPQLGRIYLPSDEIPGIALVVVISDSLWRRSFGGDPQVVGKTVYLDEDPYTIVGVMSADFRQPDGPGTPPIEVWVPCGFRGAPFGPPLRGSRGMERLVGRLAPGVTLAQARTRLGEAGRGLRTFFPADYPQPDAWATSVDPLAARVVGDTGRGLLVLFGAVALVLLVACTNVSLLLLARGARRAKEMALRHALGASRGRLAGHLLAESLLLAVVGGGAGVLLSLWGTDLLVAASPSALPRMHEVRVDAGVLAFTAGVTCLTGLVFGLLPALRASRVDLSSVLAEGGRGMHASAGATLRRGLVAAQVALATIMLVGAGLLLRSLWNTQQVDPGFQADGALTADLWLPLPNDRALGKYSKPAEQAAFAEELVRRVSAAPQVRAAALVSRLPLSGQFPPGGGTAYAIVGAPDARELHAQLVIASAGYRELMRIPLLQGRDLDARDKLDGEPVALINATMARRRFGGNAVGAHVRFRNNARQPITIVGVIGDVKLAALDEEPADQMIVPIAQLPIPSMSILMRGPGGAVGARTIGETIRSIDHDLPVSEVRPLSRLLAGALAQRRFLALLLGGFALAALALAALGIYGVSSYAVTQRRHEIAVRMAVGATAREVVRMVLVDSMITVGAGAAAGLVGAVAASRLLRGLLYGVSASDPVTYLGLALLLAAVAVLSSAWPARRAARVDPMVVLRSE